MKGFQINFVASQAWKLIWCVAGVVVLVIVASALTDVWHFRQKRAILEERLATMQFLQKERMNQIKASAAPVQASSKETSEVTAMRLIRRDWNRLFDVVEAKDLSKMKLVHLRFDAVKGQVILEYQLESMEDAAEVTSALNESSGSQDLWKLDRLERSPQPTSLSGTTWIKGMWRATVD